MAVTNDIFLDLVKARVSSVERPWEDGIVLDGSKTLPFVVSRAWSGPAGRYNEQWSIRRGMNEIIYQAEPRTIFVRGIQSVTSHSDRIDGPIEMNPGAYRLVFVVEGFYLGSAEIQVSSSGTAAA